MQLIDGSQRQLICPQHPSIGILLGLVEIAGTRKRSHEAVIGGERMRMARI